MKSLDRPTPSQWISFISLIQLVALLIFSAGEFDSRLLAQDRETKVRKDKLRFEQDDSWIYNDLEKGITEAKATGQPLLVIFRCIPCEACSEFDEQVVRRDPVIRQQMEKFVCVRIVQANGMDLSQFQFDYDQSLHVFMMNADKTIYGRFGTRSEAKEETEDMTVQGFSKAMSKALDLHRNYPANKSLFERKKGQPTQVKTPESYPSLAGRFTSKLDYQGQVVKSCIHCHQVREAERQVYRDKSEPLPDKLLYPFPNPRVLGLSMDPKERATVKSVEIGSTAAKAGFQAGDEIELLDNQPILSTADIQWVLHETPQSAKLIATVKRDSKTTTLQLDLESGWRRKSDISFRATTWDLRRMGLGGLRLESLTEDQKSDIKKESVGVGLRAKHVGQYGNHAIAKNAGFVAGDIILSVDGKSDPMSETDLLTYALNEKKRGEEIKFRVLRNGKELNFQFKTQ